jgi:hypothetical protein
MRSSTSLNIDLVLYLTFDEGSNNETLQLVTDHSGTGTNGVIDGTPDYVTETPNGSGYSLKLRKGDVVNIPSFPCNDSKDVSVNFWIKNFGQGMLFSSLNGRNIVTPTIYINSSDRLLYQYDTTYGYNWSTVVFSSNITNIQSTGWHMVTVTSEQSSRSILLYIDGVLADTQSGKQHECIGTKMQIGGNADGKIDMLADPMLIDNVRIYRRCLDPKEVKVLYEQERE